MIVDELFLTKDENLKYVFNMLLEEFDFNVLLQALIKVNSEKSKQNSKIINTKYLLEELLEE